MGLSGFFNWFQDQMVLALFIVLFIALIVTAYRRAWVAMIGVIIGLSFMAIFVVNPDMLINLGEWLSNILRLGRR